MPYPKYALMSSGAQDRWGEVPGLLGPGFDVGRVSRRIPPSRGMALRSDYTPPPRVHGLPLIICQSGFANIWCAHRVRGTRRVDTYKQRWRVWCVTLSRRRRDAGVAVVVFERPSTPPAGFAATAVLRDYIKTKFFVM